MIEEIEQHFKNEYPREGCGIIGIVKGKQVWFPCTNVAEDDNNFILSSEEYFEIKKKADIFAIVHSHVDQSNKASDYDIKCCNALGIPYYIFSYPGMSLNILQPKVVFNPLIGRNYEFGVTDCFEATRDWLSNEGIHIPRRDIFEENFWEKKLNYFTEENIKKWNHYKVEVPKKNDVLIFQIKSDVPNHCGVYLGGDIFFHHAVDRLSCRESLHPVWIKYLVGVYRSET